MFAASQGKLSLVRLLVENGRADLNLDENVRKPHNVHKPHSKLDPFPTLEMPHSKLDPFPTLEMYTGGY